MRIGVFGGSFDPVHLAHLIIAEQCREQAALDRVLFMLAARPPHKLTQPLAPFAQRFEMLELALAGHQAFQPSELERDRPGPSYTADTLDELRRRQPNDELFLIVGSDSLADLPRWYQPLRIAQAAELLVVGRPGIEVAPPTLPIRWQVISVPLLAISSTDLRTRVKQGHSIRYFVPHAVECYIDTHGLYRG